MLTSITSVSQIIVFVLHLKWVFAESYVKLQYFVIILSLVTFITSTVFDASSPV